MARDRNKVPTTIIIIRHLRISWYMCSWLSNPEKYSNEHPDGDFDVVHICANLQKN